MRTASQILVLLCACGTVAPVARADEAAQTGYAERWQLTAGISAVRWPRLSDARFGAGSGSFDETGFGLEASLTRPVARLGGGDLLFGGEIGVQVVDSDVAGREDNLTSRSFYLAAVARFASARRDEAHYSLSAGAGIYRSDLVEFDCRNFAPCVERDEPFQENAPGAFVGAGIALNRWLQFELRAHYADFGRADNGGPRIAGPFYTLSLTAVWVD